MLSKKQRLTTGDFRRLSGRPRSFHSHTLTLKVYPLLPKQVARVAVVVSTKTARLATMRNKIRRRLYTIMKKHISKKSLALVIVVKKAATNTSFQTLVKEMEELIMKGYN